MHRGLILTTPQMYKKISNMELNLIQHPEFGTIRTEIIDNNVWFCAKDVCEALGYANHHDTMNQHCRERGTMKRPTPSSRGVQEMKFINEGNLYRLILKSRLPSAKKFESWVCDEVLPSIRKTGTYTTAQKRVIKQESEDFDVMRLLRTVDSLLLPGDKQSIAAQLGVSRQSVWGVITGVHRNPRILTALYERAMENSRFINGNLYLSPDKAIEKLTNSKK